MGNVAEYLKWRGDLSFQKDGFNSIDNLILSAIAYIEMDNVFQGREQDEIPLNEIAEEFFKTFDPAKKIRENSFLRETPNILRLASQTKRFQGVKIRNYESRTDFAKTLQFAGMEFLLPDDTSYVAFRGTDDTIVGWKEDFLLAVTETGAETASVQYLNRIAAGDTRFLRIGGHSKGAHLAVYAAAKCSREVRERILNVYSNDGPGFSPEFVALNEVQELAWRVIRIIPEESVVGMLMDPVGTVKVVKSTNRAVLQHDLFSWCLEGVCLEELPSVSAGSRAFGTAMHEWLAGFAPEKRIDFINDLFAVLEASGVATLSEVQEGGLKTLQRMAKRMNQLSKETRDQISRIIRLLLEEAVSESLGSIWQPLLELEHPIENVFELPLRKAHGEEPAASDRETEIAERKESK